MPDFADLRARRLERRTSCLAGAGAGLFGVRVAAGAGAVERATVGDECDSSDGKEEEEVKEEAEDENKDGCNRLLYLRLDGFKGAGAGDNEDDGVKAGALRTGKRPRSWWRFMSSTTRTTPACAAGRGNEK